MVLDTFDGTWHDSGRHIGSFRGATEVTVTAPGFNQADWSDRLDFIAPGKAGGDTTSVRLTGTNTFLCNDGTSLKWVANDGSGFTAAQCSWLFDHGGNYIRTSDSSKFIGYTQSTNTLALSTSDSHYYVCYTQSSPAPPPFEPANWQLIRVDG